MTWQEASVLARGGLAVKRSAWAADPAKLGTVIVFSAGAGTTRAVAVGRKAGAETVLSSTTFGAVDFLADDWTAV